MRGAVRKLQAVVEKEKNYYMRLIEDKNGVVDDKWTCPSSSVWHDHVHTCLQYARACALFVSVVYVSRVKDWSATEMKDLPKGTESIECELWRYPQFLGSIIFVCLR